MYSIYIIALKVRKSLVAYRVSFQKEFLTNNTLQCEKTDHVLKQLNLQKITEFHKRKCFILKIFLIVKRQNMCLIWVLTNLRLIFSGLGSLSVHKLLQLNAIHREAWTVVVERNPPKSFIQITMLTVVMLGYSSILLTVLWFFLRLNQISLNLYLCAQWACNSGWIWWPIYWTAYLFYVYVLCFLFYF